MPVVILPTVLRRHAQGQARFNIPARTVRQALDRLEQLVPGIGTELFDEAGALRGYIRLYVNQVELTNPEEWNTPLGPDDEIAIIAMMMGGAAIPPCLVPSRSTVDHPGRYAPVAPGRGAASRCGAILQLLQRKW